MTPRENVIRFVQGMDYSGATTLRVAASCACAYTLTRLELVPTGLFIPLLLAVIVGLVQLETRLLEHRKARVLDEDGRFTDAEVYALVYATDND